MKMKVPATAASPVKNAVLIQRQPMLARSNVLRVTMVHGRKKVALNAPRVVRVRMAMGVKIVPQVNSVKVVTLLPLHVVIVFQGITVMTWVKDHVCRVFRK